MEVIVNLEKTICVTCGITHAVPRDYLDAKRDRPAPRRGERDRDGWIFCPNGHRNYYDPAPRPPKCSKAQLLALHQREQGEAAHDSDTSKEEGR
jgi:hypothetical protein